MSFFDLFCGCLNSTSAVDENAATDRDARSRSVPVSEQQQQQQSVVTVDGDRRDSGVDNKSSAVHRPGDGDDDVTNWIQAPPASELRMPSQDQVMKLLDHLQVGERLSFADGTAVVKELFTQIEFQPTIVKAYHAADANADGFVARNELEAFLRYYCYHNHFYHAFSADGGRTHATSLTRDEFSRVASRLNIIAADPTVVFNVMDGNRSGSVSYEEYCSWMARHTCEWYPWSKDDKPILTAVQTPSTRSSSVQSKDVGVTRQQPTLVMVPDLPGMPDKQQAIDLFVQYDVNQNQTLSFAELSEIQKTLYPALAHPPTTMKAYRAADQNADGMVIVTEYEAFLRFVLYHDYFYDKFRSSTNQHVGTMSPSEFTKVAARLHTMDAHAAFKAMDRNRSGSVSYDEFCSWMAQNTCTWNLTKESLKTAKPSTPASTAPAIAEATKVTAAAPPPTTTTTTTPVVAAADHPIITTFALDNMLSKEEATKLFDKYDTMRIRKLSFGEISAVWVFLFKDLPNKPNMMKAHNAGDINKDGMIDADEFEAFLRFILYHSKFWKVFSKDGGKVHAHALNGDEFARVASALNIHSQKAAEAFTAMDVKRSGFVSFEEYCTWMARQTMQWSPPPPLATTKAVVPAPVPSKKQGVKVSVRRAPVVESSSEEEEESGESEDDDDDDDESDSESEEEEAPPARSSKSRRGASTTKKSVAATAAATAAAAKTKTKSVVTSAPRGVDAVAGTTASTAPIKARSIMTSVASAPTSQSTTATVLVTQDLVGMPSKEEALTMFDQYDVNKNNKLSFGELSAVWVFLFKELKHKPTMMKAYNAGDMNADGFVDRNEFEAFLRYILYFNNSYFAFSADGGKTHAAVLKEADFIAAAAKLNIGNPEVAFAMMDRNKSGVLSYDEYCAWMARNTLQWSKNKAAAATVVAAPVPTPPMPIVESITKVQEGAASAASRDAATAAGATASTAPIQARSIMTAVAPGPTSQSTAATVLVTEDLVGMPSKEEALTMFDQYDVNKNNKLSFGELSAVWVFLFKELKHKPTMMKAYNAGDMNADGFVDRNEFEAFLRYILYFNNSYLAFSANGGKSHAAVLKKADFIAAAAQLNINNPEVVFTMMDRNKSGALSYDEYCAWMARNTLQWNKNKSAAATSVVVPTPAVAIVESTTKAQEAVAAVAPPVVEPIVTAPELVAEAQEKGPAEGENAPVVAEAAANEKAPVAVQAMAPEAVSPVVEPPQVVAAAEAPTEQAIEVPSTVPAITREKPAADAAVRAVRSAATEEAIAAPPVEAVDPRTDDVAKDQAFVAPFVVTQETNVDTSPIENTSNVADRELNVDSAAAQVKPDGKISEPEIGSNEAQGLDSLVAGLQGANAGEGPIADPEWEGIDNGSEPKTSDLLSSAAIDKPQTAVETTDEPSMQGNTAEEIPPETETLSNGPRPTEPESAANDEPAVETNAEAAAADEAVTQETTDSVAIVDETPATPIVSVPHIVKMPDKEEALALFDEYDVNKNNTLSFGELSKIWTLLFKDIEHTPTVMSAYRAADKNADGFVVKAEFEAFLRYIFYHDNFYDAFRIKGGRKHAKLLTREEFAEIAQDLHVNDPEKAFHAMDVNKNGLVSFEEFCSWMARETCQWGLGADLGPAVPTSPSSYRKPKVSAGLRVPKVKVEGGEAN